MLEVNHDAGQFINSYWRSADLIMDLRNELNESFIQVLDPPPDFDPQAFLWKFRQQLVVDRNNLQSTALSKEQVDTIDGQLDALEKSLSQTLLSDQEPAAHLQQARTLVKPLAARARREGKPGLLADLNVAAGLLSETVASHDLCKAEDYARIRSRLQRDAGHTLPAASLADYDKAAQAVLAAEERRQESLADFQKVRRIAQQTLLSVENHFENRVIAPQEARVMKLIGSALTVLAAVLLAGVFIALVVGTLLARSISLPLERTVAMVRGLERGDLEMRLNMGREDEIGQMANALDAFAETLHSTFVALWNTIGQQQQTASQLQQSEERHRQLAQEFEAVLEGIPDSLALLGADQRVLWANRGAAQQARRPLGSLKGVTCRELSGGEPVEDDGCLVERCLEGGQYVDDVVPLKDGRTLGIKAFPLQDANGRVCRVIRLASDMTERVNLRKELERSSRLAALGELSAGVAHEINNPNALTLLNLPILIQVFEGGLPILEEYARAHGEFRLAKLSIAELRREIPDMLEETLEGAKRIQRIVEDLKDFVRTEERGSFEPFDLNEVIRAAGRLLGGVLRSSTDHFQLELGEALPPCLGRPGRIEQVVLNLLQNACQALPDRDHGITLTTSLDPKTQFLKVTVTDQGRGIDEATLPRITDPFFTTRRTTGGTGLGLSVSARIVQEHGGRLDFSSSPGEGTTVQVLLPTTRKCE